MDDTPLPTAMVLKPHAPQGQPVQLNAGDPVRVGEESVPYPGWVRITAPDGRGTWVPEGYVRGEPGRAGRMLVDYDSTEVGVKERDQVTVLLENKGWAWVRTDDGREGWLPLEILGPYSFQTV